MNSPEAGYSFRVKYLLQQEHLPYNYDVETCALQLLCSSRARLVYTARKLSICTAWSTKP